MYLRFTPAFTLACVLSAAFMVTVAFGVAHGSVLLTELSNTVRVSAAATWLYVASGRRRQRERIEETDRKIDHIIRGIHG